MATIRVKGTVSPIGIAFLNAIPVVLGVGYLFIHEYWRFLVVFVVFQLAGITILDFFGLIRFVGWFIVPVWIGSIFDGFMQAEKYNIRKRAEFAASQEVKPLEAKTE